MAIQKNITDRFGVTHENAYIKINHIEISNPSIINVLVYTNATGRHSVHNLRVRGLHLRGVAPSARV